MKKLLSFILAIIMIFTACVPVFACKVGNTTYDDNLGELQEQFLPGKGPETNGYTIDYRYFSPTKENDSTKYPLVIWLHGMGDGAYEGKQTTASDIAFWTSSDFQSRFEDSNGAFILAPRSLEEDNIYWSDDLIYPLRAAIDDFIAKNKNNIDLTRIYIGGYSMGGKMTLKMAVAYPDLFAAIFPICPAWIPSVKQAELIADVPVWLTSGVLDPLVNYFVSVRKTWKNIVSTNKSPADCRFSTLLLVRFPSGNPTSSSHHSWFAVNYDMFSSDNGKYPFMKTVNGMGDEVTLTYPDGMISWLSGYKSNFDGSVATDSGNL
jgi:predicted peptidase